MGKLCSTFGYEDRKVCACHDGQLKGANGPIGISMSVDVLDKCFELDPSRDREPVE